MIAALDALGASYEVIEIDPAFADTAAFCEKYGVDPGRSCNTIIVAAKTEPRRYAAFVVLATTRLDVNRKARALLGARKASFATSEEMMSLTGMEVGGVTPFSLPDGVPLYVDERVMAQPWVVLGGGGRTFKIKVSPEVLARLGAEAVPGLGLDLPR
ncbi:MAG: hypothetical protein OEQ13_05355 [Acidobacteriota bacterium]|nr:hypothetical protein [Acidobacteriota bacterium]